ncbi:transposase [Aeromicrobium sp. YIM 150415]|uniref:IS110 family transposase n=1 Tax=Aeromicrobium sp. YIM 150415 TaxID=2803912 RepID=UPI001963D076|nr:transposase [Aeromicrobium sp. YIM 150415]MBM9463602.1 transposase [Aeromicrobium sp. YIM 150415]
MEATPTNSNYAGIDWSWQHHELCIVDDNGQRIEEVTVPHSRPGLAKITTRCGATTWNGSGSNAATDRSLNS